MQRETWYSMLFSLKNLLLTSCCFFFQYHSASGLSPSRIPMAANTTATSGSVAGGNGNGTQQKGVEERLRILLSLLESSKEDAKNGREDTLQYLSQLESVARRLKDQLLNDNVSNDSKVREFKFPTFMILF